MSSETRWSRFDPMTQEIVENPMYDPIPGGVHNHGPNDGPGTACPERLVGECRLLRENAEVMDKMLPILSWAEAAAAPGSVLAEQVRAAKRTFDRPLVPSHPGEDHTFDTTCTKCGQGGLIKVEVVERWG